MNKTKYLNSSRQRKKYFFLFSSDFVTGFELPQMDGLRRFVAELIGTALLLFAGCMGCLTWGPQITPFFGALSFGLVVMMIIQIYGGISGAHLNPAVTIAAVLLRLISIPVSFFFITNSPISKRM